MFFRQLVIGFVAYFYFCFVQEQISERLTRIVDGILTVGITVKKLVEQVMRHLCTLFAALAALAVVIVTVLLQRRNEGFDKLVDVSLFLRYKAFVIVKAVAALHVHNRHVGNGFLRI